MTESNSGQLEDLRTSCARQHICNLTSVNRKEDYRYKAVIPILLIVHD